MNELRLWVWLLRSYARIVYRAKRLLTHTNVIWFDGTWNSFYTLFQVKLVNVELFVFLYWNRKLCSNFILSYHIHKNIHANTHIYIWELNTTQHDQSKFKFSLNSNYGTFGFPLCKWSQNVNILLQNKIIIWWLFLVLYAWSYTRWYN